MSTRRTVNKRNYDAICADYNSGTMKLNEICQKYNLKSQQTVYNIIKTHSIDNTDKQPAQNNYKPIDRQIDRQINKYADKPVERYTEKLTAAERKSAQYVDEIMQNRQQQSKQNDINAPKRSKEEYERRRQMLEVSSNLVNNYING